MYRRIVVPIDGSELAERALPQAEALARLAGAPLHLVRVVDLTGLARYGAIGLHAEATAFQLVLAHEEDGARDDLERTARELRGRGGCRSRPSGAAATPRPRSSGRPSRRT